MSRITIRNRDPMIMDHLHQQHHEARKMRPASYAGLTGLSRQLVALLDARVKPAHHGIKVIG